jgi:hypothetical protein
MPRNQIETSKGRTPVWLDMSLPILALVTLGLLIAQLFLPPSAFWSRRVGGIQGGNWAIFATVRSMRAEDAVTHHSGPDPER